MNAGNDTTQKEKDPLPPPRVKIKKEEAERGKERGR